MQLEGLWGDAPRQIDALASQRKNSIDPVGRAVRADGSNDWESPQGTDREGIARWLLGIEV
jgi:hypothetical protein